MSGPHGAGDGDPPRGPGQLQYGHDSLRYSAGDRRAQVIAVHAEPEAAVCGATDSNLDMLNLSFYQSFLRNQIGLDGNQWDLQSKSITQVC